MSSRSEYPPSYTESTTSSRSSSSSVSSMTKAIGRTLRLSNATRPTMKGSAAKSIPNHSSKPQPAPPGYAEMLEDDNMAWGKPVSRKRNSGY